MVLSVDAATCRLQLSIKAMLPDPLKASVDDLAWSAVAPGAPAACPEARRLVATLSEAVGVSQVVVAREAQDPHRVTMELEVYLVRTDAEGDFTAMAVVGTSATELEVKSTLTREQFKQLLQRAARQAAE